MWGYGGLCHTLAGGAGGGLLGSLVAALFIGALSVGLVVLALWLWRNRERAPWRATGARPSPLAVLELRYARGEIGRDEFQRMRQELTAYGAAPED